MSSILNILFWEAWHLTYKSFLFRVVAAVVVCSLIMVYIEHPGLAMLVVVLAAVIQGTFPAVSSSSSEDKGGFPFNLGFVRPLPTWLLVGFPMIYFSLLCGLSYFIPIFILNLLFDFEIALLPGTSSIITVALVFSAMQWWTSNRSVRFAGWIILVLLFNAVIIQLDRALGPGEEMVNFDHWVTYAVMILIVIAALGLAIWGIDRQRHSAENTLPSSKVSIFLTTLLEGDWSSALSTINRTFGFTCPTGSPTKAEMWKVFSRQASEMLLLSLLSTLSVLMLWLFTDLEESESLLLVGMLGLVMMIHLAFRNIYGVRNKQGHSYLSSFDATLAIGSAQLIGVRILASVLGLVCGVLFFIIATWFFSYLAGVNTDALKSEVSAYIDIDPLGQFLAWSSIGVIQLIALGVCLSTIAVFSSVVRKPVVLRHLIQLGIYAAIVLTVAYLIHEPGKIAETIARVLVFHLWLFGIYLAITTFRLFGSAIRDHILSSTVLGLGILFWLIYALVFYMAVISSFERDGIVIIQMTTTRALLLGVFCLLPLTTFVLAPWAYGRIRHQ